MNNRGSDGRILGGATAGIVLLMLKILAIVAAWPVYRRLLKKGLWCETQRVSPLVKAGFNILELLKC